MTLTSPQSFRKRTLTQHNYNFFLKNENIDAYITITVQDVELEQNLRFSRDFRVHASTTPFLVEVLFTISHQVDQQLDRIQMEMSFKVVFSTQVVN